MHTKKTKTRSSTESDGQAVDVGGTAWPGTSTGERSLVDCESSPASEADNGCADAVHRVNKSSAKANPTKSDGVNGRKKTFMA